MKNKYVVLEHLLLPHRGKRFWTINTEENCLYNGRLAYKEVHFTDDDKDAIKISQQCNNEALPTFTEIVEFYSIIDSEDIL